MEFPVDLPQYENLGYIGSGGFSKVFKVKPVASANIYSLKIVDKKILAADGGKKSVSNEISIQHQLR